MEFLKEILGEELFAQVAEKINAHNGNEANKEHQIKVANLGTGEYVGKGRFDSLQALFDGQKTELEKANGLIAELRKATKGNEEMQGKITAYDAQVAELQKQLAEVKIAGALKVALLSASAKTEDIDYLTYRIRQNLTKEGKTLELDDAEQIKGWDDILSGIKTQCPSQFSTAATWKIEPQPLPKSQPGATGVTPEQFAKMGYQSRLELFNKQPEVYAQLTGKK